MNQLYFARKLLFFVRKVDLVKLEDELENRAQRKLVLDCVQNILRFDDLLGLVSFAFGASLLVDRLPL